MTRIISSVVGISVLAVTVAASAQTLADMAKKETDRRKTVKHPAKVYTNDDVANVKPILPMMENDGSGTHAVQASASASANGSGSNNQKGDVPGPDGGRAATAAEKAAVDGKAGAAGTVTPGVKAGDEGQWRQRMQAARDTVSRTQLQLESMRARAAELTAVAATASEDQRANYQRLQQEALQEYDRLRADLQRNQKALTDLQAEAARNNVPPGWLR
jgi:hypothetical protein